MNTFFYLAIDRVDLGKSVVIEFIGPIAVAAAFTRTRRNVLALALAGAGVVVLSGVEIDGEPLGLLFILCASLMWATYIVVGRRVAALDRGTAGLGIGLAIGAVAIAPVGALDVAPLREHPSLLVAGFAVGLFSNAIGYGIDQHVMRRIPVRRFAVLLALLPVTAMVGRVHRPRPATVGVRPRRRRPRDRRRRHPGARLAAERSRGGRDAAMTSAQPFTRSSNARTRRVVSTANTIVIADRPGERDPQVGCRGRSRCTARGTRW